VFAVSLQLQLLASSYQ